MKYINYIEKSIGDDFFYVMYLKIHVMQKK